ncbi:ATP-binding cassette domain-containing protein [Desulfoscipio geothermicus]|uniref:ABC-2 type transport system ATP-binding protein n=1 Tax=Desulfoscipio geothermicus DSM 3669 TaxID=1121426 RepID=A0A1I6CPP4_9FIRM|nr:ATP-binding cassette domain-containing protein [Desulfoscipio geothermicus]SFQ95166.1 ABC-2 type transport system ATP-binding protein [Desulfoscipio geothermicus DSM 3669]
MSDAVIQVENLVRKFKDLTAVRGVSFQVARGEVFGFLGPNGAGKSTTIKMLATLLKPTAGRALINGYDVVRQQDRVRRSIGLVFQDPSLDERLTARENLFFHAMLYNVESRVFKRRMQEMVEMVELTDRLNDPVKYFSGGMKRRLEIARGFLHYPQVLFLDEPTVGLDPQTRSKIWEYIHALRQRENITIFMTTHYMEEAENCHRIAIIDHGEIVAMDTPANLKKLVGGDIITILTTRAGEMADRLAERFGLRAAGQGNILRVEVEQGEAFIPLLVREMGEDIKSVTLHKPSLDDVFLKLTGREIREESVSAVDRIRVFRRGRRR